MVVSWGSQESRGLVIRVAAIDYEFCHGNGDANTPGQLSCGKAQVAPMVLEALLPSRLPHGYCSLASWLGKV